jgi:sec-independent protein translocase protein TatB
MPSFADSAVIFVLALILLGPKRLPELARQLGKLMGEFRRASNDFRMQMEDELRIAEQEENQKKIDALAPAVPVETTEEAPLEHPHLPSPIAEEGEIKMMPPSTGLPEPATDWSATASTNAGVIATEDEMVGETPISIHDEDHHTAPNYEARILDSENTTIG